MTPSSASSPDELDREAARLHTAALQASQANQSEQAIALWKQSLALAPVQPTVHYLLGAEYAHTRQYGEAVVHMSLAVEQAPAFPPVRLQLALLWLTLGSTTQVPAVVAPLLDLAADDAFFHFGGALLSIAQNQAEQAERALVAGLGCAIDNAPLRQDMERLLASVRQAAPAATAPLGTSAAAVSASTAALPAEAGEAQHGLVISAYLGSTLKH